MKSFFWVMLITFALTSLSQASVLEELTNHPKLGGYAENALQNREQMYRSIRRLTEAQSLSAKVGSFREVLSSQSYYCQSLRRLCEAIIKDLNSKKKTKTQAQGMLCSLSYAVGAQSCKRIIGAKIKNLNSVGEKITGFTMIIQINQKVYEQLLEVIEEGAALIR